MIISPYASALIALGASWAFFLWVALASLKYARKGKCPVCQVVKEERKP